MGRESGFWVVAWLCLWGVWMVLVDTVAGAEIAAGAVAGAIGATVLLLLHREGLIRFRPRLRWTRCFAPIAVSVVRDTAVVSGALVTRLRGRPVRGVLREIALPVPLPSDGRGAARRAALVAGISVSPNTFVIGIAADGASLLVHQLQARDPVLRGL